MLKIGFVRGYPICCVWQPRSRIYYYVSNAFFRRKPMSCLGLRIKSLICLRLKCPSALFIEYVWKVLIFLSRNRFHVDRCPTAEFSRKPVRMSRRRKVFIWNTCQQPCARNVTPQTTIYALKFNKWWQCCFFNYKTEYNVWNKDHKNKMAGTQILSPLLKISTSKKSMFSWQWKVCNSAPSWCAIIDSFVFWKPHLN